MSLKVSEIFGNTIQGEGKRRGYPSAFIRLAGCNMSCKGFGTAYTVDGQEKLGCDTYYAVDNAFKNEWQSYGDAQSILLELNPKEGVDVVITGGEPLIHWNNPIFQDMLKHLVENDHFVTIETNGSIEISLTKEYQKKVMFSISPKLKSSGEPRSKRINKNAILPLLENKDSYFKFVLSEESIKSDYDDLSDIALFHSFSNKKRETYVMPLTIGSDFDSYQKNSMACVDLCYEKGWLFTNRDHFTIWGDKKGV